jgi:hypothetical protein
MSQALEGTPQRGLTLTEQANGQRIGRAMFIGHTAGWLIIFGLIVGALVATGFVAPGRYHAVFALTQPPTVVDLPVMDSPHGRRFRSWSQRCWCGPILRSAAAMIGAAAALMP